MTSSNSSSDDKSNVSLADAEWVQIEVRCESSAGCDFSREYAYISLSSATVTVEDGTSPALNPEGGTILTQPTQEGRADIVFDAEDNVGIEVGSTADRRPRG